MNSKEALNNIAVEFDEMGMICSNIAYKDFWGKDLHFKEIFGCKYEIIMKDLKRLEQLEKENQGVKDDNTKLWHSLEYANNENAKLKQAITILEDRKHILKYNGIDGALELGWLTQKEYKLLKEVFESVGDSDE